MAFWHVIRAGRNGWLGTPLPGASLRGEFGKLERLKMKLETMILAAFPVVLGAILAVSAGRDWLRRRRTQHEIARGLDQRWESDAAVRSHWTEDWTEDWTAADETRWQRMGRSGMLGNGWEKR